MSHFFDYCVILVLCVYAAITAMFATPAQSWSVFHHELLVRIVPRWNFFAPNPGIHDYHLLIRDRSIDGEVGPWISITEFDSSRPWYACVWNPEKRRKKALFDTTCILVQKAQLASEEEMPKLQLSIPYLLIASLVDTRHRSPLSVARQFCLVQRSAQAPIPLVVFTSAFHSLVESEG